MSSFHKCDTGDWEIVNHVLFTYCIFTSTMNMISSSNADLNSRAVFDIIGLGAAGLGVDGTTDNASAAIS